MTDGDGSRQNFDVRRPVLKAVQTIWRIFYISSAIFVVFIVLMFSCTRDTLDNIDYPNPSDEYIRLTYKLDSKTDRVNMKSFKAYLSGAGEDRILLGEGRKDPYRYTYWESETQLNVCPIAHGLKAGNEVKIFGQDGAEHTITITTRCGPRELKRLD